jgi:hypothetical protein
MRVASGWCTIRQDFRIYFFSDVHVPLDPTERPIHTIDLNAGSKSVYSCQLLY